MFSIGPLTLFRMGGGGNLSNCEKTAKAMDLKFCNIIRTFCKNFGGNWMCISWPPMYRGFLKVTKILAFGDKWNPYFIQNRVKNTPILNRVKVPAGGGGCFLNQEGERIVYLFIA